jgi:hypothetical protein
MRASNREALRGRWHLLTFVTVVHATDVLRERRPSTCDDALDA